MSFVQARPWERVAPEVRDALSVVTRALRDDLSRARGPARVVQLVVVAGKAGHAQALLAALAKREA